MAGSNITVQKTGAIFYQRNRNHNILLNPDPKRTETLCFTLQKSFITHLLLVITGRLKKCTFLSTSDYQTLCNIFLYPSTKVTGWLLYKDLNFLLESEVLLTSLPKKVGWTVGA